MQRSRSSRQSTIMLLSLSFVHSDRSCLSSCPNTISVCTCVSQDKIIPHEHTLTHSHKQGTYFRKHSKKSLKREESCCRCCSGTTKFSYARLPVNEIFVRTITVCTPTVPTWERSIPEQHRQQQSDLCLVTNNKQPLVVVVDVVPGQ